MYDYIYGDCEEIHVRYETQNLRVRVALFLDILVLYGNISCVFVDP